MNYPADFNAEDRLAAAWIRKMADREKEALNALYALYHRPVRSLIQAILRDAFEADEVLQDTYIRAYRQADRYDPLLGAPFAWLATIGKRLAIDRLRRRRARPDRRPDKTEQLENLADKGKLDEEESARQNLEIRWVLDCLVDLQASQREAIEMAFFKGYTQTEIAKALGKPVGTVKSDLHRGLMNLRKAYLETDD